jgi:uncharacterized protein
MSLAELIGFLMLTGAAAYAQTRTGFAFGLITMGSVGLTGLLSLPDAAMIVSVLTLVNATQMLLKGWRDVAWREFWFVMATSIPLLFMDPSQIQIRGEKIGFFSIRRFEVKRFQASHIPDV